MKELIRTLKDLSVEEWKDRKEFVELWVRIDELKQEAIKHIKLIENNKPFIEWRMVDVINPEAKPLLKKVLTSEGEALILWIKHFFNITERDLK